MPYDRRMAAPQTPLAAALERVGDRWSLLLIEALLDGPRRFGELRTDIPRISAKVLSTRLRELTEKGVVERRVVETSPPSVEYSLSPLGKQLIPVIETIVHVGAKLKQSRPAAARPRRRATA